MAFIQRNPDGSLMYNWYDPRNIETGFSELLSNAFGQARTDQLGSDLLGDTYAKKATMQPVYDDAGQTTGSYKPLSLPTTRSVTTNPTGNKTGGGSGNTGSGNTGANTGDPTGAPTGENEFEKMVARARAAFESAIRDADYMLERARGVRDESLGLLNQRRKQFQELFDTGNIDITNEYQGRGGELGESAQNRRMADAAALQAMGLGGSAVERAQNRQSRDELRALRALQQDRDTNKAENTRQFNERNLWADTQESAALRAYDDAVNARRSLGEKAGLVHLGDVDAINRSASDYLGNIQARQNALLEAGKGINSFVANPLNVVIPSQADAVRAQNYSADTRGGQRGDQNVNLEEQKKKLAMLNLQAGGNLYGLA